MKNLDVDSFCQKIIEDYKKFNLDEVEIKVSRNDSKSVKTRNLKLENIEKSTSFGLVLNVYKGRKQATLKANNLEQTSEKDLLEKACSMVNLLPEEKYSNMPNLEDYPKTVEDLDISEKKDFSEKKLLDIAIMAEDAMLQSKEITNTEGASVGINKKQINIYSSKGFSSNYKKTLNSISAIAIAGKDTNMQRDYEYAISSHLKDLPNASIIGKKAAERSLSRLKSRKIESCKLDVIFEPRVASSILSSFCSCINGNIIARGTSFLVGKKNKSIFNKNINISNNPLLKRGVGSVPFDYNGVKNFNMDLVKDGILENYFLSTRSARQLEMTPNGNSSICNLVLEKGHETTSGLISGIKKGFYVTEMLGMSFNQVNGDYSRGATGFMIENGEITFPVSEVTIADNMQNMLIKLTPGDDLIIKDNINCPTILIEKMSLAGI